MDLVWIWSWVTRQLVHRALDEHLLLYNCGTQGNFIKLIPPLTISETEMDEAVRRLHKVILTIGS